MSFPSGTTEHPINKSGKRKILVSVWDFGAVHPQSERSYYLCNDHPAKMRPCLARAVLQLYGESPVLDPMAGVGTTLVEAMLLGMGAVGVEYEKKFVDQANKNIEHVRKLFSNKNLGKAVCIKGDARDLSCLDTQRVGSVTFSPPYFNAIESVSTGHQGPEGGHLERQHKLAKEGKSGYGCKTNIGHAKRYGSIIFSPPFKALKYGLKKGDEGPYARSRRAFCQERIKRFQGYSSSKRNIGNIPEFGSIVFSPPYCGVMDAKRHVGGIASRDASLAKTGLYSEDEANLGNIRSYGLFSSIVFSPPYADVIKGNKEGPMATSTPNGWKSKKVRIEKGYSRDPSNIGNTQSHRTYLGEMLKVYRECFRVLRPGKFMVVVVKDIRRRNLTIPLGADTVKLCQLAGFEVFDVIINKMYFPSFWVLDRAIKDQKKGVLHPLKTHEYVLVFKKPL